MNNRRERTGREQKFQKSDGQPSSKQQWPGDSASQPQDIPRKGWLEILRRVKQDVDQHSVSLVAAGIAFYGLLALFPLLIAFVSIYSLFADPSVVEGQLAEFSNLIPTEVRSIITDQLHKIVENSSAALGWSSFVSIVVALWSANQGSMALMEGFNIAYDESEGRGVVKKYAIAFGLTLSTIVFMLVALTLVAVMPAVFAMLHLDSLLATALAWGRWLVLAIMLVLGLAILNRYAPCRNKAKWTWVSVGSVASTILWIIVSAGFSFYVSHFGSYNKTYGSLGGVIVLLLWLYLSSFVILLGAELNAQAELQTRRDTTRGKEKPLGARGAMKADHTPRGTPNAPPEDDKKGIATAKKPLPHRNKK